VEIELIPLKMIYIPGEQVQMALILTNASMGEVESVYVSPLPSGLSIVIPESRRSIIVKKLSVSTGERKLAVGEKTTYDLTWDQKDEEGKQVAPGWYFYESNINVRMESFTDSFGAGVRERAFLIQYPQGALEKVIELNQSLTANSLLFDVGGATKPVDIVFTLKRVELSQERASFFILVTSPDDPLTSYDRDNWPSTRMEAQYTMDGVVKDARAGNRQFTDDGIEFRIGYGDSYLDPVPGDARELTFVITRFGDWQGPWEFKVPLE